MMKKMVFVVIALVFVLSACSTPAPVATATAVPTVEPTVVPIMEPTVQPVEGITGTQLIEKYFYGVSFGEAWKGIVTFQVVEPYIEGSNYLKVLVNGTPETLINDGGSSYYNIYVDSMLTGEIPARYGGNIFSEFFTDHEMEKMFYVMPYDYASLALVEVDFLPPTVEDIMSWDDTKASLSMWDVSHVSFPINNVILNMTTGEIYAGSTQVYLFGDDETYFFRYGQWIWGYVHVENNGDAGYMIYISQSEPNKEDLAKALEYANSLWTYAEFDGPVDACEFLQYYNIDVSAPLTADKLEQIGVAKQYCGVYYTRDN